METLFDQLHLIARDYWGAWLMMLFLGVIAFALSPKRKTQMEQNAMIPLRDDGRDDTQTDVEA